MNVQKTRVIALAAAVAALLAAVAIQADPAAVLLLTPAQEQAQGHGAVAPASAPHYNDTGFTPPDATWVGVFSAHWR